MTHAASDQAIHFDLASLRGLEAVEDLHYWTLTKRYFVRKLIERQKPARDFSLLDLGCGNGRLLSYIKRRFSEAHVAGLDGYQEAIDNARRACPSATLVVGDLTNLDPSWFPRTYDVVTLLDVLEHLDNPAQVLQQVKSLLAPGGILIATVPAMQSLWSDRDAFLGHRRRFSCWDFSTLVQSAGLSVQHRNYLFSFLFAPAYIHRKILSSFLNKKGSEVEADELKVIPGVNGLLRAAGAIDVQWSLRWPLPFGTSTYCVAQRPSG